MKNNVLENMDENSLLVYKKKEEEFLQKKVVFGFWLYLLSDLISFSVLFSVYFIFKYFSKNTSFNFHFKLLFVFFETVSLLLSSFSCSKALTYFECTENHKKVIFWLKLTFFLGLIFLLLESFEIYYLFLKNFFILNAYFSSYLVLIGFHFLHIFIGLIWIILLILYFKLGNMDYLLIQTRLKCFSLFWHFLDIIWICIFMIIYLMDNIV